MTPILEKTIFYVGISIIIFMPFAMVILYYIFTKEYKKEIKKAIKNQKKINK